MAAAVESCPDRSCPESVKATVSTNVPSAAINTVGSFFGHDGVLETIAVEMMRASGEPAPMLSRVVASRYFAR